MRRFPMAVVLVVLLTAVALPIAAINTNLAPGDRVCVLQVPSRDELDDHVARDIRDRLERTLRERGFQTIESRATLEDVRRSGAVRAEYFVEIASADADVRPSGSVVAATGNVGVDVSLIISRVAAELRIYDGRTLELVERHSLRHQNVTFAPSGIGVGGYHGSIWMALPFVGRVRYRSAVRAVVDEAASKVADVAGAHR